MNYLIWYTARLRGAKKAEHDLLHPGFYTTCGAKPRMDARDRI
jgi:hypothetical protein